MHAHVTEIMLSFANASYTIPEEDSIMNDLIAIVKVDDRITEQELEVFVQLSPFSGSAQVGKCFILIRHVASTKI